MKEPGAGSRGMVPDISHGVRDKAYNQYLSELDPKGDSERAEAVRQALAAATDTRFQEFLERLYLPHYRNYSLAAVAKVCNISLAQFAEFWQKAQNIRALTTVQDGIVNIAKDMIDDARSQSISCDRCDGTGWVFTHEAVPGMETEQAGDRLVRQCPVCKGEKRVKKPGDTDSRRMLLEMAGHTGKANKGAAVQIVQNFGGAGIESAVQKMSAITFDVEAESSEDSV